MIKHNLHTILTQINAVANQYVTPYPTLIAVSKHQTYESIQLAIDAGQTQFGENYVQEGIDKLNYFKKDYPHLIWHMIGSIQSNKTRLIAEQFNWVHTIDRLKIAQRLSEQRPTGLPNLNVLIQINIDAEPTKNGISPTQALDLILKVASLPRLNVRGLMCIPEKNSAAAFKQMAVLYQDLRQQLPLQALNTFDVLSMGMSQDFPSAIAQGATHIRIGTAIFGIRQSNNP
jgi:PLP dependent protein